jgi:predicted double-glycine peptidase
MQLRGRADKRQVEGAKVALQHNFGLGSAAVITLYRKYSVSPTEPLLPASSSSSGKARL